jgi:hypothetical protein
METETLVERDVRRVLGFQVAGQVGGVYPRQHGPEQP